jgi:orotidine-5'-phosphate decarboxylase
MVFTIGAARFVERLRIAQESNNSLLCVGLDPDPIRFPKSVGREPGSIVAFNRAIIDATRDLACCYKPNLGFYLPFGGQGVEALAQVVRDVPGGIPVLLDGKFGDFNVTSAGYARAVFDTWRFDAVTLNPFLGRDALEPFLAYQDRGLFILAKTSNPGSHFLQDRELADGSGSVTLNVARSARDWNEAGNVGLVVGATWPAQLAEVRSVAPDLPILIPGVGAQEGDLDAAVRAGIDADRAGILVSASRAIIYATDGPDFRDAARAVAQSLRDQINAARASTTSV